MGRGVAWLLLLGLSCAWFEPRTPQEPVESQTPWREPTQASHVIQNLPATLHYLDLVLYGRCLDSSGFVFHADEGFASTQPSRFENWDYGVEVETTRRLFDAVRTHWAGRDSGITLVLSQQEWLVAELDSTVFQSRYVFQAHHGRPDVDSIASGTLRWALRRSPADRLWYVVTWWDFADSGAPWTAIKGAFRQ